MDTQNDIIIIDNGTGYTKMGYAGNNDPSWIIPTAFAEKQNQSTVQISRNQYDHLDFYIGNKAIEHKDTHSLSWPIQSGEVKDWEVMEKFWHRSLFDYLRCEPEESNIVLTEPPMNLPENREQMAEIMFETFGVQGLFIAIQASMALYSNWFIAKEGSLQRKLGQTGTVCDSGDGVTHVIPIYEGYPISSQIKHIPIAGRDITKFIMKALKNRKEPIDQVDLISQAKVIKENHCYCAKNCVSELKKYDSDKNKEKGTGKFRKHKYTDSKGKQVTIDVGYERFLGPEILFHPEFVDEKYTDSIDKIVDEVIQNSPIDCRRKLYQNIVLSGGTTCTKNFKSRLQYSLSKRVNNRLKSYETKTLKPKPIPVTVSDNPFKKFSVWHGASKFAVKDGGLKFHTREEYEEHGPSICRSNIMSQNY